MRPYEDPRTSSYALASTRIGGPPGSCLQLYTAATPRRGAAAGCALLRCLPLPQRRVRLLPPLGAKPSPGEAWMARRRRTAAAGRLRQQLSRRRSLQRLSGSWLRSPPPRRRRGGQSSASRAGYRTAAAAAAPVVAPPTAPLLRLLFITAASRRTRHTQLAYHTVLRGRGSFPSMIPPS